MSKYEKNLNEEKNLSLIDQNIMTVDGVICRHLESVSITKRGMVSQDILSHLRNFVEHIMFKFYANGKDLDVTYSNIRAAIQYTKSQGSLKDLYRFHNYLQIVASHYTLDEENSERLMLKYYEYLIKIKKLVKEKFNMTVLNNLDKFPLNSDSNLKEYYQKIASIIDENYMSGQINSEKYYIQKIKPFFVNNSIYYEVTIIPAYDYASKFNRVIAFTSLDLTKNYAVRLDLRQDKINILGKSMPIIIIRGWKVSVRACEFKNFSSLLNGEKINTGNKEQDGFSKVLTLTGLNLVEIVELTDFEFRKIKNQVTKGVRKIKFFNDLEFCRNIIRNNKEGSNVLRYLLFTMNNRVIKKQFYEHPNNRLSDLYIKYGSIPFDSMPFNSSLLGHNPKLIDLFYCLDTTKRKHELLARFVRNNTEINGKLFTSLNEVEKFEKVEELINTYNGKIYEKHYDSRKLKIEYNNIFINGYRNNVCDIINNLKELSQNGISNYLQSVSLWLKDNSSVDCDQKKEALKLMFQSSKVALIYGSAGTGKSTLINHISHFFADKTKLYLAQTNPAVDNLKRRVTASNATFSTIAKFTRGNNYYTTYDILVIDECSTVSNSNMKNILSIADFKLLILVGDSYQIESIRFGNWFDIARDFVPETSVFELTKPYRTDNENLIEFWDRVRNMDDNIIEIIARQGYSGKLDDSIFVRECQNEIILCLNYDGLYGINNINRFLQESNPNIAIKWGIQYFKVNDPILFNASERFSPIIYNNMKGKIVGIEVLDHGESSERIQFDIELDIAINGLDALGQDFILLENIEEDKSIIRFSVYKSESSDEDDSNNSTTILPFQVAYAVSIHKAQGLEYSSVKIVVTDEVDELLTHNIFYTAITRAREKLKIYWTPEVEKRVLDRIESRKHGKDIALLKKSIN